eukprot:g8836.t1
MHVRPWSFLLCGRRAFSRAPGRGHRIQAPLSARDLLARAGGWEWAENWSEEMTEMQKKAVKIRRKVPWDNTCPEGSIRVGVPAFVSGRLVTAYQHPKCFLEKSVTFDEYETKGGSCQCKAMRTKINRGELRCVINTGNSKFSLCAKALKLLKPAVKMTGAKTIKPAAFVKGSGIAKLKNAKNKKVVEKELGLK